MAAIAGKVPSTLTHRSSTNIRPVPAGLSHWRAQPHFPHHVANQARQSTRVHSKRATEEDERLIEEMKRAAEKGGVLESGVADAFVKVLAVSAAVGVVIVLAYLAQPVIQNTVASFPSA
ncbi:hypothetical protein PLESTB_001495100 [Pleodorina starrii]|uniref:Uncharacterized protein n=1 Tax=Pleodorina starrii TaxID=330485 RepID=A0A9W6BX73_9CHLO|nr:hypothetical protein PLESTM_001449300 [Pleodorina starrii]GLC59510.1 hypothetical protein PLESTB_001495100 [Pleodorina starrii]GLC66287.1 hypothetical protein PLESTF_000407700 [Pleodorina starrii]